MDDIYITRCKTDKEREERKAKSRRRYALRNAKKTKEYNRQYYLNKKNKAIEYDKIKKELEELKNKTSDDQSVKA